MENGSRTSFSSELIGSASIKWAVELIPYGPSLWRAFSMSGQELNQQNSDEVLYLYSGMPPAKRKREWVAIVRPFSFNWDLCFWPTTDLRPDFFWFLQCANQRNQVSFLRDYCWGPNAEISVSKVRWSDHEKNDTLLRSIKVPSGEGINAHRSLCP